MEKRPRGRPPKPQEEVLNTRLELRLAAAERDEYERAAEKAGVSLAAWMRDRLSKAAKRELR
jgi:predicted HicB family RNase H-like nuclease